jgi:hypothetical protein
MKIAIACAFLLGLSAPPEGGAKTPEERDRADLSAMEAKIDRRIGAAACESGGECRAVEFGAKPCGGPWKYKIYSTRQTDTAALLREVAAYKAKNSELNHKHGWASDCSFVSEPAVTCRDGGCKAGVAGATTPIE